MSYKVAVVVPMVGNVGKTYHVRLSGRLGQTRPFNDSYLIGSVLVSMSVLFGCRHEID